MIDLNFLSEIEKLKLRMKKKINSKYYGEKESFDTGVGAVFKEFKSYVPGDDFRRIDWKIFARSNELFVRRYEEEKNLVIHVLLDSSASMDFKLFGEETKFQYSAKIALGIIYLAIKAHESYRFATFSDKIDLMRYNATFSEIIDRLNSLKISGTSSLDFAQHYRNFINSKSIIFLISDFLMPIADLEDFVKMYRKHNIFLIHVLDKAERDLSIRGSVIIEDMETNATLKTYLSSNMIRAYSKNFSEHFLNIKNVCDSNKANFIAAETSEPLSDIFHTIINNLER